MHVHVFTNIFFYYTRFSSYSGMFMKWRIWILLKWGEGVRGEGWGGVEMGVGVYMHVEGKDMWVEYTEAASLLNRD